MAAAGDIVPASLLTYIETMTAAWSTWSPTLTNLTLGNGAVTARYRQLGKTLDYRFKFVLGSTSAVGTDPKFTLPAAPSGTYTSLGDLLGRGVLLDSGTANRDSVARLDSGSTVTILQIAAATGNHTQITATSPWTWATGDSLQVVGTVELA